jgi:hypothetical protein
VLFNYSKLPFRTNFTVFLTPFRLATSAYFRDYLNLNILNIVQEFILLGAVVYLALHINTKKYCILLFWFLIPIISLFFSKVPLPTAYFIALFPVQFIIIGVFVDAINSMLRKKHRVFRYGMLVIAAVLICYQLFCSLAFISYIRERKQISWMGYGPPFKYRVEEIKKLMGKNKMKAEDIHQKILEVEPQQSRYKYDFSATKYIVENIDEILK